MQPLIFTALDGELGFDDEQISALCEAGLVRLEGKGES